MYVGPFFYLNHPHISQKGLFADPTPGIKASRLGHQLVSPLTHRALLDRIAPQADEQDLPRGQVVYDLESGQAVSYLDRCAERYVDEIVRRFELTVWVVEYDDQYSCPRCDHLVNRF